MPLTHFFPETFDKCISMHYVCTSYSSVPLLDIFSYVLLTGLIHPTLPQFYMDFFYYR